MAGKASTADLRTLGSEQNAAHAADWAALRVEQNTARVDALRPITARLDQKADATDLTDLRIDQNEAREAAANAFHTDMGNLEERVIETENGLQTKASWQELGSVRDRVAAIEGRENTTIERLDGLETRTEAQGQTQETVLRRTTGRVAHIEESLQDKADSANLTALQTEQNDARDAAVGTLQAAINTKADAGDMGGIAARVTEVEGVLETKASTAALQEEVNARQRQGRELLGRVARSEVATQGVVRAQGSVRDRIAAIEGRETVTEQRLGTVQAALAHKANAADLADRPTTAQVAQTVGTAVADRPTTAQVTQTVRTAAADRPTFAELETRLADLNRNAPAVGGGAAVTDEVLDRRIQNTLEARLANLNMPEAPQAPEQGGLVAENRALTAQVADMQAQLRTMAQVFNLIPEGLLRQDLRPAQQAGAMMRAQARFTQMTANTPAEFPITLRGRTYENQEELNHRMVNEGLIELKLASVKFGDNGAKALAIALSQPRCTVRRVDFFSCDIGDSGAVALAEMLQRKSCQVTHLDLGNNHIRETGVRAIAKALPHSKLETLSLKRAKCDDALIDLALALPQSNLKNMNLQECQLDDAHGHCLAVGLGHPECEVMSIQLADNQMDTSLSGEIQKMTEHRDPDVRSDAYRSLLKNYPNIRDFDPLLRAELAAGQEEIKTAQPADIGAVDATRRRVTPPALPAREAQRMDAMNTNNPFAQQGHTTGGGSGRISGH